LEKSYYEAVRTKDRRFDGKFFLGVKTTGVYCRPVCPATPQLKNILFFPTQAEAERAGFRPCLRCRPESAPLSPAWMGKSAVVQRAARALIGQDALALREDEFASRFGLTARHLRRLFTAEIGKTPRQLAQESRLNLARKLISETDLSLAQVALASGFRSVRRFNEAFKERFHRSPGAIRKAPMPKGSGLTISLSYRPPYNFRALLAHYERHRVGALEWFEGGKMHRIVAFGKSVGKIAVSHDEKNTRLLVEIDCEDVSKIHAIAARVRALFDLDSDPQAVAAALGLSPELRRMLAKHRGIRLPSGWDPFETAIATILGQLVSVERGRSLVADLVEMLGEDSGLTLQGKKVKLFPSPEKIAAADLAGLKTTGARKKALRAFSAAVASGAVSLAPTQEVEAFLARVLSLPGIGPWTASYMALKCLRHTDAFPGTDLILSRCLERHPRSVIEKMRPWRGYAAVLLWEEYAGRLSQTNTAKRRKNK
jgi:AraC family transcriptional regulator of adaptative response / DNA-3-methyladenine glycosylase II